MPNESNLTTTERWELKCRQKLIGKTITNVRYLTEQEKEDLMWFRGSLVIFFEDGSHMFASADDEGNDAGALFTSIEDLPIIPVI